MLVPIHATLVPMFILMSKIGLLNTKLSLIFPYIAFNLPITIFLLVSFMKSFPKDIEESAYMDGAGIMRIFFFPNYLANVTPCNRNDRHFSIYLKLE